MFSRSVCSGFIIISLLFCANSSASVGQGESAPRGSSTVFDGNVTPDAIFGFGNANGGFTIDRQNGVEVGLRAKLRFDDNGLPDNIFNSNGDGTYTYIATVAPGRPDNTGPWGFEWSINTNYDGSTIFNLDDLTYELGLDADPGPGTDFLTFDPLALPSPFGNPFWDHAIGDNSTANGDGDEATDEPSYQTLIAFNNVAQNSWRYAFFPVTPLDGYNAKLEGEYTIYLEARNGIQVLARSEITVIVVKPKLNFDQDVIPELIFGTGNVNGAFTTDQRNGIELGLRGKLRFDQNGEPQNDFGSNNDGTYSFDAGQRPGDPPSSQTSIWSFEWSVNADYRSSLNNDLELNELSYELGLDGDPSLATDFLVFNPIPPMIDNVVPTHFFGNNSTGNGGGATAGGNEATYLGLIDNETINVAQNSWRYDFFLAGALENFDPTVDGTYTVYLAAFDANGVEVGRTQIQFLIGETAVVGEVAEVGLEKTTDAMGAQMIGDTFSYTLTVTNSDLATTQNLSLQDDLPDNLSFVSGSCNDGTDAVETGQQISFDLVELGAGESTICTIDVEVSGPNLIVNQATVFADNDDQSNNNSASVTILGGNVRSVGLTGDIPTANDNDYTRINDAIQIVQAGDVIMLEGIFDWRETEAFSSWVLGSDGVTDTSDDFNILVPEGAGDFALTASAQGDATIIGPGDLAGVEFEGFLLIFSEDNRGIEISNLVIDNFEVSIGQYFTGGGINVYDDTQILNNRIIMARDIAGSSVAGEGAQNIGIHFAFGDNIRIADNLIEIQGDTPSNGPLISVSVAMQSNTNSGAYEGLEIVNNMVRVLNAAAPDPEIIIGIWENSNAFRKNILIEGNRFENADPVNDAALNQQQAFRITSQRDEGSEQNRGLIVPSAGAIFRNNFVDGANVAYQWLPGRFNADWTNRDPLTFTRNTAINSEVAVRLESNGSAIMRCNRFFNNTVGIEDVSGVGTPPDTDVESIADDNWWGCNAGPNGGNCDTIDPSAMNVIADSWLVAEFAAAPDVIAAGGNSTLTLDVTNNNDGIEVIDCTLPDGVPVEFAATLGTVMPASTDTVAGISPSAYIAPGTSGTDPVSVAIDGETLEIDIEVIDPPVIDAVDPNPLPGNVSGSLVTITGGSFGMGSVILVDGDARSITIIDVNTAQLNLTAADLLISSNGGDIEFVLDNSAAPGGGVSAPVVVPVVDDSLFSDGFETLD
ncbi:MAG: DUF11 domain-containing protein [Pseudomonadota bacterium]